MNAEPTLTDCLRRCAELGVAPTQFIFAANVATQTALLFEQPFDEGAQLEAASLSSPKGGEGRGEEAQDNPAASGMVSTQIPSPQPSPRSGRERESELASHPPNRAPRRVKEYRISTSKFGIGQVSGSNKTPLGLHRIAEKIGAGCEPGTVFKGRKVIGRLRDGLPLESITTRILWLEGLEEGFNRGGNVDTHARYIYIHGFGDQASLGRPTSLGCIHLADADLIPLYDLLPSGTLVWIAAA